MVLAESVFMGQSFQILVAGARALPICSSLNRILMLFSVDPAPPQVILNGVNTMVWTAPVFEEVSLCCEINSYASAKL